MPRIGAPCWVDLLTSDPERSQAFYGRLFGWTVEDPGADYGGYMNFLPDGDPGRRVHAQRRRGRACPTSGRCTSPSTTPRRPWHRRDRARRPGDGAGDGRDARSGAWPSSSTSAARSSACGSRVCTGASASLGEPGTPSWFELHTRDYEQVARLLPRRLRVEDARGGRHARVPLHDRSTAARSSSRA